MQNLDWTVWSTLKRSSGAELGHGQRDIAAFDTVSFHSNLSSLWQKFLSDVPTGTIVLSYGPKLSKRPLKKRYWWLKNKERNFYFRFVERPLAGRKKAGRWNGQSVLGPTCDAEKDWHERSFRAPGAINGCQKSPLDEPEIEVSFFIFKLPVSSF